LNVEAVVTYNYHCAVDVGSACKNKALKRIFGSARGVTVYTEEVIQRRSLHFVF
jgi:hypothetical protein